MPQSRMKTLSRGGGLTCQKQIFFVLFFEWRDLEDLERKGRLFLPFPHVADFKYFFSAPTVGRVFIISPSKCLFLVCAIFVLYIFFSSTNR